jgi:hypothetical protein
MSTDDGKTHHVGDGCQPAHDPRIDGCDDCNRGDCHGHMCDGPACHCACRAEVQRLRAGLRHIREVAESGAAGREALSFWWFGEQVRVLLEEPKAS